MLLNQTQTARRPGAPVDPSTTVTARGDRPTQVAETAGEEAYRPDQPRSAVALWSARHKWLVLLGAFVIMLGGVAAMAGIGIATQSPNDQLVGDSAAAFEIRDAADFGEAPTEFVIVTDPDGPLDPGRSQQLTAELTSAYEGAPGVAAVGEPFVGPTGAWSCPWSSPRVRRDWPGTLPRRSRSPVSWRRRTPT